MTWTACYNQLNVFFSTARGKSDVTKRWDWKVDDGRIILVLEFKDRRFDEQYTLYQHFWADEGGT